MSAQAATVPLTGSNQLVTTGLARYRGIAVRETSGTAPATVRVFDNTTPAGPVLDDVNLGAGESARELYPDAIRCAAGIYVQIVTGSVEGSVRID